MECVLMSETLRKLTHKGDLIIGETKLPCGVLDDGTRVLSETGITNAMLKTRSGAARRRKANETDGPPLPVFLASENLKPFIPKDFNVGTPIKYKDGSRIIIGYDAAILPIACDVWLSARSAGVLLPSQQDKANNAEILMRSLARIGIVALIDEATGYQFDREYDALRMLLQAYLSEELRKWTKQFPDEFFEELDRLYGNDSLTPRKRPQYYGKFINKYVYEPIENGKIEAELQSRYIADDRKHRKHQHFTELGEGQLRLQIGRILGLMEVSPNMTWFKNKQNRQGQLSFLDDFEDE